MFFSFTWRSVLQTWWNYCSWGRFPPRSLGCWKHSRGLSGCEFLIIVDYMNIKYYMKSLKLCVFSCLPLLSFSYLSYLSQVIISSLSMLRTFIPQWRSEIFCKFGSFVMNTFSPSRDIYGMIKITMILQMVRDIIIIVSTTIIWDCIDWFTIMNIIVVFILS